MARQAEHGNAVHRTGGTITTATPNVKTTTQNLADLVAFTRALQWARSDGLAQGRPICVRYNNEYAARIATGAWKAKKHKAFAEEARQAWAQLTRDRGGRVWMKHVALKDSEYGIARGLALAGKRGQRDHSATVN